MIPVISVIQLDALEPVCDSRVDLTALLKAAGGLLAENPQLLSLNSSSGIVLHNACNKGVQLLGLQAVTTAPAPSARSALYTAAVLQHAALLLLLLVSDSAVFVLPTEAVSPALLQLLHLLATVHHALIWQQQDSSGQAATSALAQLLAGRQQPVQLHIALQATIQQHDSGAHTHDWPAIAAAAVQQAEQTLLKCKAVELSPALSLQQQYQQSGRARTAGSSSSGRKGRLFELAGVHCCCHGGGPNTAPARHRAVLSAVQQQLLAFDRPMLGAALQHSSSTTKQEQQQLQKPPGAAASIQPAPAASLPGLDQLLGSVIASTTAAAAGGVSAAVGDPPQATAGRPPVTQRQLLLLWQDLLQALFPGTQSVGWQQSAVPQPGQQTGLPAWQQQQQGGHKTLPLLDVNLTVDDATQADEDASVSEDSWDDEEQAWEEVQQEDEREVQQRQQQQQRDSRQQQAPGRLLAAAVDPLYVVSAQNCRRAAVGALRAYLQVLPQRCTAAVHTAAVQHAIQQYTRAAAGPAALELQEQLVACCLQVWQAGRQQCSQLSLTGRPCVLSPHDAAQQPHSSSTQLQVCAPDGSSMLTVPDWFDVTTANITPAQQLLAQQESANKQQHQQQQQQSQRKKQAQQQQAQLVQQGRLLPVLAQLLLHRASPAGAAAGSSTSSSNSNSSSSRRQSRLVLGPWMSLWQLSCGAGAYDTQAGLPGPAWVPGFNKLQPLAVLAPPTAEAPSPAAGAAAVEGAGQQAGQQPQPQPRRQPHGKQEQTFASQLKRKGGRGAGAASAPPEPVLGPEDFPTLQQAVGGRSKKHAPSAAAAVASAGTAAPQQQQQQHQSPAAAGGSDTKSAGQQASTQAAADDAATAAAAQAAQRQQDLLVAAWSQLAAAGSQGPTTGGSGVAAAVAAGSAEPAADLSGSRQPAGGRGVPRGGGRGGGRWPAAAAAGTGAGPGRGRHPASVSEAAGHSVLETAAAVLTSLSIGLEYESLSGSRIILQPQQLAALVPQAASTSRRQAPDTSFAAAATGAAAAAAAAGTGAAAAAAMHDNNPTEGRHRRGGQQQQQGRPGVTGSFLQAGVTQQQPQQSPAQAGTSPTPTATGSSTGFGGLRGPAVQLLLGDIPLFLSPDLLKLPETPTAAAAGAAGADTGAATGAAGPGADGPSGSSSDEAGLPVPLSMLQLQRIYVRTPAGPFRFAAQPRVRFIWQAPTQHEGTPASTAAAAAAAAAADASDSSSSGSSGVVFECSEQQLLVPDSLTVLNLPKVYAAPTEWAQAVDPSAAALAAVTDREETVTAAVSSAGTASDNAGPSAASEAAAAAAAAGAGSSSGGSPAADLTVLPEGDQSLEPLIPVQLGLHRGRAGGGAAAGAAGWSAVLCAGWLYPVGCGGTVPTALTAVGGEGAVK